MEYLLSIDAGTTSFKGAIFDRDGNMIVSASCAYDLMTASGGIVEFSPEGYIKALKEILSQLFAESSVLPSEIIGLAIDSQGETLILIDKNGKPLRNAIVWLDSRAISEANEISSRFGVKKVYKHTGQPEIAPTWPACKLLWVRKNEPDLFSKIHKALLLEDYLIYTLTGVFAAERSLLTSTIYYDINSGGWWDDMLDFTGIRKNQLPGIYDSGEPVSEISPDAAKEFGLSTKTKVIAGALDQLSGMIGSGAMGRGKVCETTGTCLAVCSDVNEVPEYNSEYQIPCHAGVSRNRFYQIFWSQTAGAVLEWFKSNFYKNENQTDIMRHMNDEAESVPPGSDGLTLLPHLSGKACPEFNPSARGVFYGIDLTHGRGHFTRAIMESVAYMLREHIETAESTGVRFDEIRSLGGGSNSPLWNQIKADVTGKRIVTIANDDPTCLGTAILAGVGTGLFKDIESAAEGFIKDGRVYYPDNDNKSIYDEGYAKYAKLYSSLKDVF